MNLCDCLFLIVDWTWLLASNQENMAKVMKCHFKLNFKGLLFSFCFTHLPPFLFPFLFIPLSLPSLRRKQTAMLWVVVYNYRKTRTAKSWISSKSKDWPEVCQLPLQWNWILPCSSLQPGVSPKPETLCCHLTHRNYEIIKASCFKPLTFEVIFTQQ